MFEPRQTAPRFHTCAAAFLFTASYTVLGFAQSVATTGDQWRAAGSSPGTTSQTVSEPVTTASSDPTWQLPNSQSAGAPSNQTSDGSNPLRKNATAQAKPVQSQPQSRQATPAREPRAFQAPANARPLNASNAPQSAAMNFNKPATPQARNTSAAAQAKPAHVANQAYLPPRTLPPRNQFTNQNSANQPRSWSMGRNEAQQE